MDVEVYCDESNPELFWTDGKSAVNKYVLIGGLWIPASKVEFEDRRN
jgi:hypothetical protein